MKIVVKLWNNTTEVYDTWVDANVASGIGTVETQEADSAGEGVVKLPPGYVIESVDVDDESIMVQAALYSPDPASAEVLTASGPLANGTWSKC